MAVKQEVQPVTTVKLEKQTLTEAGKGMAQKQVKQGEKRGFNFKIKSPEFIMAKQGEVREDGLNVNSQGVCENCCWHLVEAFKKFMTFLGLTPDDDPLPGMRLLAIATELANQIKFYCNDSTIQPPTFRAKNMPLSREKTKTKKN